MGLHKVRKEFYGILFVITLLMSVVAIEGFVSCCNESNYPIDLFNFRYGMIMSFVMKASVVICIFLGCFYLKNTWNNNGCYTWSEKIIKLLNNSFNGGWHEISIIFSFIILISWLPDSIDLYIKEAGILWINPLVILLSMYILIRHLPINFKKGESNDAERKLLLSGMSNILVRENAGCNLLPLVEPLRKYYNIEKIMILLSDSVTKGCDKLEKSIPYEKNETLKNALIRYVNGLKGMNIEDLDNYKLKAGTDESRIIKNLITDVVRSYVKELYSKDIDVVFSSPTQYNNFENCNKMCYAALQYRMSEGNYSDKNIVVNITPGTSIVSSVMLLNSIKGNRVMVYLNQDTEQLVCDETPDVTLVQFGELMNERSGKK